MAGIVETTVTGTPVGLVAERDALGILITVLNEGGDFENGANALGRTYGLQELDGSDYVEIINKETNNSIFTSMYDIKLKAYAYNDFSENKNGKKLLKEIIPASAPGKESSERERENYVIWDSLGNSGGSKTPLIVLVLTGKESKVSAAIEDISQKFPLKENGKYIYNVYPLKGQ